jgi:hypothetical protein
VNERVELLVNAPMNVCPQTELQTPRQVRRALKRNVGGHNYGVYCLYEQGSYRISAVRTRWGQVEVRLLGSGVWVVPNGVYVEG